MKKLFVLYFVFLTAPVMAIVVDNDVPNACGNSMYDNIYAIFEITSYTCNSGYFLPADTLQCAPCPAGYTCNGGTFNYNAKYSQGLTRDVNLYTTNENNVCAYNFTESFVAKFTPNEYTCAAGQYLPADAIACVSCPNGYTCSGGTYSFNETIDQGLVGNTITINWNGALAADIATNDAGSVTYGGDIRTPVRPDPSQIPIGQRFKGWRFSKPSQN